MLEDILFEEVKPHVKTQLARIITWGDMIGMIVSCPRAKLGHRMEASECRMVASKMNLCEER